jgi:formylmethanofuran dehydrogenase subunit E
MNKSSTIVDRLMILFENDKIKDEIISFTEKKYISKSNEKCNYCNEKPTKKWKLKKKIIKVCIDCCNKYRDTLCHDI